METVFDALKAMGKATSIELAARLDISREEVLNELWELKKAGFVDKSAYTWRVADNNGLLYSISTEQNHRNYTQ